MLSFFTILAGLVSILLVILLLVKKNPSPSSNDVDGRPGHFTKQMNFYHLELNRNLLSLCWTTAP